MNNPSVSERVGVFAKGLDDNERKMLEAVVRLSARRQPVLFLCQEHEFLNAAVIIIDGKDQNALDFANRNREVLMSRPVVWIDHKAPRGHTSLHRPVMWANLPIIISQAVDNADVGNSQAAAMPDNSGDYFNKIRVLAVDDSDAVREFLAGKLKEHGCHVTSAPSGEAALSAIHSNDDYDVVLMDVLMPGIDGYDACRAIKNKFNKIPVVMLTGKTSPFDRIRGKMAGCDAYLTKPVELKRLLDTVKKYARS